MRGMYPDTKECKNKKDLTTLERTMEELVREAQEIMNDQITLEWKIEELSRKVQEEYMNKVLR